MRMIAGIVTVLAVGAIAAGAAKLEIAADRMAVVDGERTFILGLYENPESEDALKAVADAGFNLVHAAEDQAALDRLHQHGLWAWLNTGYRIDLQTDAEARKGQLQDLVTSNANHPAVLVWEVPDEALWNCWYSATQWRRHFEPEQLNGRIAKLEDKTLADDLSGRLAHAAELHGAGKHAEAEQLANGVWTALGETSPSPDLNISNAAARAESMAEGMREGYALLRQLDPNHPVWMNHAPRNQIPQLATFNQAADIVGCDIYPVPRGEDNGHSDIAVTTVASVGAYTLRMQEAAPGKPVWMVLQGFGWNDIQPEREKEIRRPNLEETRFMAYDCIVRGARGILYWGSAYIEKDSALWNDLLTIARELDALQPVVSAPDTALNLITSYEETWGSVDLEVEVLGKDVDGKTWLIVVNEWREPLRYTIHGLKGLDGQRYRVQGGEEEATVENETLTLLIRGHGIHVLEPAL